MKKTLSTLMILLLACTMVFAGGDKETAAAATESQFTKQDIIDANITITMWHAQTKANGEAIAKVVDHFNNTN